MEEKLELPLAGAQHGNVNVADEFHADAQSIGAMHGSARGNRNVSRRLQAMERLAPLSGDRLLEVGCATGEYTSELARNFDRVDGIEIEQIRLDMYREHAPENVNLALMSVNDLDFEDDQFDMVTMIEVLEHLADIPSALSEIKRVLKPGGRLLLTTPSRRWPLEQHGVLFKGKRYRSLYAPGLVWIKPLHERLSDAAAFEPGQLADLARAASLELEGHTFMMPPLDSFDDGHRVHSVLDKLEEKAQGVFGQTIVASLRKPNVIDLTD